MSEQSRNSTALAFSPQRGPSRRKRQKTGREPILPENDRKPFRMISLQKIRQQLPWIDILTKNIGGWGYIPFSNSPIPANAAALGAGSNPFAAGCCTSCLSPWTAIGAAVYLAKDTRLDRIVAIKVLPSYLADSSELRERFQREARTIASLNHPHICTLYDIGHQDGIDYLVMEYLSPGLRCKINLVHSKGPQVYNGAAIQRSKSKSGVIRR